MRAITFAVFLLLVVACASSDRGITVTDAWARPTPPNSDVGALYVSLANNGDADVLTGADSDVCGSTELHDTVLEGNVMEMRHIKKIEVESGDILEMVPGGVHIMCLDMDTVLVEGLEVTVSLHFQDSAAVSATVSVEQR